MLLKYLIGLLVNWNILVMSRKHGLKIRKNPTIKVGVLLYSVSQGLLWII